MKYLYGLAILCCLVLWSSCRNDFETTPSTGNLQFSKDTVYLDTVFTNIGSSTYNLKVYNRSDDDIHIPTLRLADGQASNYRLNVDGIPGKEFTDVQVLSKDSIFIFIETTLDINNLPGNGMEFLYTDQILFDAGGNEQRVELVTLVQDAVFLFPDNLGNGFFETIPISDDPNVEPIPGFFLDDTELNFTNEKPYVIYGYAGVNAGKTLTIDPGARIHFHANSGILVRPTGSIKANGAPSSDPELLENEIIFEGDRLEPDFSDVPGQWGTIWLQDGSIDHDFSYTTIKNASIGIRLDSNEGAETLSLKNVQVYNSSFIGLFGLNGNMYGENVVVNNSGQSSLSIALGGTYTFNHCTFGNYWTNSFRSFPSVQVLNFFDTEDTRFVADLDAKFANCIIYGNEQRELGLARDENALFTFNVTNSLIRFEDPNGDFTDDPLYQFEDMIFYNNIARNLNPAFQDTANNNFNIELGVSGAEALGITPTTPPVPVDLNGTNRANPSDAGAYESTEFPPE
tara:strand:- start:75509 stop:77047 length:1539 start_codon:yes stop_codon:yes gene_type:complete